MVNLDVVSCPHYYEDGVSNEKAVYFKYCHKYATYDERWKCKDTCESLNMSGEIQLTEYGLKLIQEAMK